jgi:futalosine hydrolase
MSGGLLAFARGSKGESVSVLIVSSTLFEVGELIYRESGRRVEGMGIPGTLCKGRRCDVLVSGVGQSLCGIHVTRALMEGSYSHVIQAGIAGSFTSDLPLGAVVVVREEAFGDLGAEDHGTFLDLFDMGLLSPDRPPFKERSLVAPESALASLSTVPRVKSVTVNRVLSEPRSIKWIRETYAPHIVNMEGAALFYAALTHGVPFTALRSVSDMVGPRDKSSWRIPEAVHALDLALEPVVDELFAGVTAKGF